MIYVEKEALEKKVKKKLRQIKKLLDSKVDTKIDSEGEYYWTLKNNRIKIGAALMDRCERLLNRCAEHYRSAGLENDNEKYLFMSRMVAHIRIEFVPALSTSYAPPSKIETPHKDTQDTPKEEQNSLRKNSDIRGANAISPTGTWLETN